MPPARVLLAVAALIVGSAQAGLADAPSTARPRVFVDCRRCSDEFLRTEIVFVDYVRDRHHADVHVLVTTQDTGGGGTEHTLAFTGQLRFQGLDDTLKYVSPPDATEDEVRRGLARALKLGLVRYAARTAAGDTLEVTAPAAPALEARADRWNHWVFTLRGDGHLSGEESSRDYGFSGSVGADRVTEAWKVTIGASVNQFENRFRTEAVETVSVSRSRNLRSQVVKSVGPHWSAGAAANGSSSTFNNTRRALRAGPALEYDVFPYAESTQRQLRLQYRLWLVDQRYREETVFGRMAERLWSHELSANLDQKRRWGSIQLRLSGSQYLHDGSKNRLDFQGDVSLRVVQGLSVRLSAEASRVRDQLTLPKRGATSEEVLLRRRQLSTGHSFFAALGLSYSFGSIYSHVVNPRMGN